jgi:hypothetical protein
MTALCTSPQCQTTAGCICGSFETRHGGWDWGKNNVVFSRGFRCGDMLFEIDAMEREAEAMTDLPRSVMEEADRVIDFALLADAGLDATREILAEALLARDKRAAGIARNNDPFPEEGEYIASLILTYPEGKEDGL